jgi:hypothetical protein
MSKTHIQLCAPKVVCFVSDTPLLESLVDDPSNQCSGQTASKQHGEQSRDCHARCQLLCSASESPDHLSAYSLLECTSTAICLRLHASTFEVQMKSWQKRYIFRPRWGMLCYTRMRPGTMLLVCDVLTSQVLSWNVLLPPLLVYIIWNKEDSLAKYRNKVEGSCTVRILRESPCGGGGCVLVVGLKGCYWWKTVWRTRELHCYIQTENI